MHIACFVLKLFSRALQEKYKDQTEAVSLMTDVAIPTNLIKGRPCRGSCPNLTPTHIIRITGGFTKCPSCEHKPVHQTINAHHCTLTKICRHHIPLTHLRIKALTLPDMPLTPPRRQTSPPPCTRPSSCFCHQDHAIPCHRYPSS
jgi:hypothetical protein